jgi:copper resistance protein B
MKLRALPLAAALAMSAPAMAQHEGHGGDDRQVTTPAPDPNAEHTDSPKAADFDPHAGHRPVDGEAPPIAGPPAEAFSGPDNAADAYFGDTAMAQARRELGREHGNVPAYRVLVDRLEAQARDGTDRYLFDAQAWYGGDIDKLWLKVEGDGDFGGKFEKAELRALWSHAIGPWFDLQAGVRYGVGPGEDRGHLALGVQGLAPYWIELDAAAFLSERGDVTARIEAEHDVRITQRLIMQPRAEADLALQDIPGQRIGSGLTAAAVGVRLRYQVTPLLGPYLGIEYDRAFGDTRSLKAAANEDLGGLGAVAGIRAWF